MGLIDVTQNAAYEATIRGLQVIDREWLKVWSLQGRQELAPAWKEELQKSRPTPLQRRVLVQTSTVALSRRTIVLKAGTKGRLRSGAPVSELARAVEFGQDQSLRTKYVRKDKPTPAPAQHTVVRRTAHPVGPKVPQGNVFWPAARRFAPRAAAVAIDIFMDQMRRIPGVD